MKKTTNEYGTCQKKRKKKEKPRVQIQKKHKDRLFRLVFEDKRDLLILYNAIRGTNYQDTEDLEVTTMDDILYMGIKNDLSFLIDSVMNLYEHQSTDNPNMPLRGLEYFARLYKSYVKKIGANLYGSRRIALPYPQYLIFYNGTREQPDRSVLRLSDSYMLPKEHKGILQEPGVECTAVMLNINSGKNGALMERSKRLSDYAEFVACVRRLSEGGRVTEEIMDLAIEECIADGILEDILTKHRGEVREMFSDFDAEEYVKNERRYAFEDGVSEGIRQGIERGIKQGIEQGIEQSRRALIEKKLAKGKTVQEIADALEEEMQVIEKVIRELDHV